MYIITLIQNLYKLFFITILSFLIILKNFYIQNFSLIFKLIYIFLLYFFLFFIVVSLSWLKNIIFYFKKSKIEVVKIYWPNLSEIFKIVFTIFSISFFTSIIIWFFDVIISYMITLIINLRL